MADGVDQRLRKKTGQDVAGDLGKGTFGNSTCSSPGSAQQEAHGSHAFNILSFQS